MRKVTDLPRRMVTIQEPAHAMLGQAVAVSLDGHEYIVVAASRVACMAFLTSVGIDQEHQKTAKPVAVVQKESVTICKKIAKDCKS
jgi:hypothetical protein